MFIRLIDEHRDFGLCRINCQASFLSFHGKCVLLRKIVNYI
jgi:hypothetical protein